jgi:hypothetical protein
LSCRFSGSGGTWSLFAGGILLREALLDGFGLPVVVSHSPPVFDDTAAELTEHGARSHHGNLPRPIRVGQDFAVDKLLLLFDARDDLEQGPILVKEQV